MRSRVTRILVTAFVIAVVSVGAPGPAGADPVCQRTDPATGQCLIWVEVPSEPAEEGEHQVDVPTETGPGSPCIWSQDGAPRPVPCSTGFGYWTNSLNCYLRPAEPQPPPGATFWEGAYQDSGLVYECFQPQMDTLTMVWLVEPPAAAASGPSPGEVAEMAVDQMNLSAINIGIAPKPGPGSVGLVGMPVWMWAQNPDDHTYGPATASASAGGITVTATARVHQITWDMGDGTEVVCRTAGTPYEASFGQRKSPDCGHVYQRSSAHQASGKYTVTATSDWGITWSGAGQIGTIRLNGLSRSVEISVGEAQVLVQ